jgi:hypothetical protein
MCDGKGSRMLSPCYLRVLCVCGRLVAFVEHVYGYIANLFWKLPIAEYNEAIFDNLPNDNVA